LEPLQAAINPAATFAPDGWRRFSGDCRNPIAAIAG
jgi:hypothetical protein